LLLSGKKGKGKEFLSSLFKKEGIVTELGRKGITAPFVFFKEGRKR